MQLSYWEHKTWFTNVDFTIVGSGIVGLNCALFIKHRFPKSKILILEKGSLPEGASTKNAGFACFGSISELCADLESHSEEEVYRLVEKRWSGIQLLRQNLGDDILGFEQHGGHEVFLNAATSMFESCSEKVHELNRLLEPIFKERPFVITDNRFNFDGIQPHYITHRFEGQLDAGGMMRALLNQCQNLGITILNGIEVESIMELETKVGVKTEYFEFNSNKVIVTTNGFASRLLPEVNVEPARAQVLITRPIENLHIQGTFHLDEGYYYFRNIDNRILFGGGRNLDFVGENTMDFGQTQLIQNELERMLREVILPNKKVEIERRWSGIMGVGKQKTPVVEQISPSIFCGVRLGGMGVALGSLVGKELADLL